MIEDLQNVNNNEVISLESKVEEGGNQELSEEKENIYNYISSNVSDYFNQPAESLEHSAAIKFYKKYIETQELDFLLFDNEDTIKKLTTVLVGDPKFKRKYEDIINEVKKVGLLQPEPKPEKIKEEIVPEHIDVRTEETTVQLKEVENTNLSKEKIEENIENKKGNEINLLSDKPRMKRLYEKIETHETESWEYYQEFVDAGLVTLEEAEKDYTTLQKFEGLFQKKFESLSKKDQEKELHANRIATIVERGAEHAFSELEWYGATRMRKAPNYMDKLCSVDSLLEIQKEGADSDYLAIATDVTFNRLDGKFFKAKAFKLFKSLRVEKNPFYKGNKPNHKENNPYCKYAKNEKGELMEGFIIPRTLLHFKYEDARMLAELEEKITSPDVDIASLRKELVSCPQKTNFLQQIFYGCKILSGLAQEEENSIFRRYAAIENSIKELSWKHSDIKKIIEDYQENEAGRRMEELAIEYREVQDKI